MWAQPIVMPFAKQSGHIKFFYIIIKEIDLPIIPTRSDIVACSWMPMPFLIIRNEPSLRAPEHVTNCLKTNKIN